MWPPFERARFALNADMLTSVNAETARRGETWRRLVLRILVVGVLLLTVSQPGTAGTDADPNPCVGTVEDRPDGTTLLTIQGARDGEKTPALLVSVAPDGSVIGVHNDTALGRWWSYDIDPLADRRLLHATTEPGITVVEVIDPGTGELLTVERIPSVLDAHDVDRLDQHEYVMVDKGPNRDRVLVYNMTTSRIVWQWRFDRAYPRTGGGDYGSSDWTHVNDVDVVDGGFLLSVRNFDQVILLNRTTKRIEWRLGEDDKYSIMSYQHNPQHLLGPDGNPVVLIADSENDRVVEYERRDGDWVRTWALVGGGLDEPRDADRLPNGNTLVTDRFGHRVLEVTPTGRVVWEFYAPWQPYDAERYLLGDEPSGPTATELGTTGSYTVRNSANFTAAEVETCSEFLTSRDHGGRLVPEAEIQRLGDRSSTINQANRTPMPTPSHSPNPAATGERDPWDRPVAFVVTTVLAGLAVGIVYWWRR